MLCLITNRRLSGAAPRGHDGRRLRTEERIAAVMAAGAQFLMIREKDLSEAEYIALARPLAAIAAAHGRRTIVNSSVRTALAVDARAVQLSLELFRRQGGEVRRAGLRVGVSVHSLEEALEAREQGADWVLAGHIFDTACKEGIPGRGLEFLRDLVKRVGIPVWAVGGIRPENVGKVLQTGAETACVMSALLECADPEALARAYLRRGAHS